MATRVHRSAIALVAAALTLVATFTFARFGDVRDVINGIEDTRAPISGDEDDAESYAGNATIGAVRRTIKAGRPQRRLTESVAQDRHPGRPAEQRLPRELGFHEARAGHHPDAPLYLKHGNLRI